MTQLGQELRAIAERQPPPTIPSGFFHRARRRARRRRLAAVGLAMTAAAGVGLVIVTDGYAQREPLPHSVSAPTKPLYDLVGAGADGPLGWLILAVVLVLLCVLWREAPRVVLVRRLVAAALIGALLVLAAPPGVALWGEPHGRIGLPDRLAEPRSWTWAADLQQSPPGRVALVFSGPATHGNIEEGRLALLAADGDRYRVFDVFTDYLEPIGAENGEVNRNRALSPDGRYLASGYGVYDLSTGRRAAGVLAEAPAGWSADGQRIVRSVHDPMDGSLRSGWQVWDLRSGAMLREIAAEQPDRGVGGVALSPAGDRIAVEQGDRIVIYPTEGGTPTSWPRGDWRIGDSAAWSRDGRLLAMIRRTQCAGCTAPLQIRFVDAETGETVDGGEFSLPADVEVAVQGWRAPDQLVVQVGGAVEVFTRGTPTPARLLDLPAGVTHIEIATDRLTDPVRRAGPPTYGPPNNFLWLLLAPAALVVLLMLGIRWLARFRAGDGGPAGGR
ncbi:hypothetical protein ABZS66_18855 [Dactylosporangium sp. NPDC005572]|uniref:WD40 repeat domain-containing protein n=1 Tax=Dactylosporangium sp. NPDC005572 TaxID=3156889 RepID=UPI0033AC4CCD